MAATKITGDRLQVTLPKVGKSTVSRWCNIRWVVTGRSLKWPGVLAVAEVGRSSVGVGSSGAARGGVGGPAPEGGGGGGLLG